jgi:hypothetical protein
VAVTWQDEKGRQGFKRLAACRRWHPPLPWDHVLTDLSCIPTPTPTQDIALVKRLVQRHLRFTGSEVARRLLLNWEREKRSFVKVRGGGWGRGQWFG